MHFNILVVSRTALATAVLLVCLAGQAAGADGEPPRKTLPQKLSSIVLANVEFKDAPIREILHYLSTESIKFDAEKTGVNFIVLPSVPTDLKISLRLKDAPLADVLKYIAQIAGLKYRIESNAVVFFTEQPASKPVPVAQVVSQPPPKADPPTIKHLPLSAQIKLLVDPVKKRDGKRALNIQVRNTGMNDLKAIDVSWEMPGRSTRYYGDDDCERKGSQTISLKPLERIELPVGNCRNDITSYVVTVTVNGEIAATARYPR